jgi:hypothetical protein
MTECFVRGPARRLAMDIQKKNISQQGHQQGRAGVIYRVRYAGDK